MTKFESKPQPSIEQIAHHVYRVGKEWITKTDICEPCIKGNHGGEVVCVAVPRGIDGMCACVCHWPVKAAQWTKTKLAELKERWEDTKNPDVRFLLELVDEARAQALGMLHTCTHHPVLKCQACNWAEWLEKTK